MLKVRFSIVTDRVLSTRIESESETCEFLFTDSAGDPLSPLIDGLVSLRRSLRLDRTVSFLEEPDFIDLTFSKHSEDRVLLQVVRRGKSLEFSYTGDCSSVVLSFWRGLRLLEESFSTQNAVWCHGSTRMFEGLPALREPV